MGILTWTWIIVGLSFALYIGIAFWAKAKTTGDFYVAAKQIHPVLNGMASSADWMSAASFISMAGMISFMGRDEAMYLMGWTGGYVLLGRFWRRICANTANIPCRCSLVSATIRRPRASLPLSAPYSFHLHMSRARCAVSV